MRCDCGELGAGHPPPVPDPDPAPTATGEGGAIAPVLCECEWEARLIELGVGGTPRAEVANAASRPGGPIDVVGEGAGADAGVSGGVSGVCG